MTKQAKRLVVPAVVAGALLLAPNAVAGSGQKSGGQRACPETATSCQPAAPRSGTKTTKPTKPLKSAAITSGTDSRGQQVWHWGSHTMY